MKRISIVIIALLLAVSLVSCSADSLGDYKKAAEKTDQIKRGQTTGEFTMLMDFNTEGMTEEQIKKLNYFKDMKGSFNASFDDEAEKGIFRNYLSLGGLGFDFDMYINGKEAFIKLPVVGKYMKIDDMQASMMEKQPEELDELISKETLDAINASWIGMLKKEDIFRGKDIVLTTPDGEVKTTEYTIKLNDEQIKSLAAVSIDALSKDEKLKSSYEKYIKSKSEKLKGKSFEELLSEIKEGMKEYNIENFSYTAYVDIDGYIVNEMIEVSMKVNSSEPASMTGITYKLDMKNWDINKEQTFDFPVLTEENTLDTDNLDQDMPFMIEDLIKDNK